MTTNVTSTERKRKRDKRVVLGFYAVGIVALLAGMQFGFELVGSVIYLLGIVGGVASGTYARHRTSVTMVDERERRLAERGSHLAVMIAGGLGLAVFPVLFVLDGAGLYTFTPVARGVLYALSGFFLLYGACCLGVKDVP